MPVLRPEMLASPLRYRVALLNWSLRGYVQVHSRYDLPVCIASRRDFVGPLRQQCYHIPPGPTLRG